MDRNDILPDLDSNEFNINAYQLQALDEANNEGEEEQPEAPKEKKSLIKTIFFCSSSKTKKERKVSEDVE